MKLLVPVYTTLLLACCINVQPIFSQENKSPGTVTVRYKPETADFCNPERGFYRYSSTLASNYSVLNLSELKSYRSTQAIPSTNYKALSTLVFRYFVLDGFIDGPLTTTVLNNIKTDFDIARIAGIKLIPRFVYTIKAKAGSCPEGFICPPYGDAPKEVILNHISQLKPILMANADVIACVQMGFIGTWGENYYTDHFGDPSSNAKQLKVLDENWRDRTEIVQALLNALPADRMVQVRYPQFKQRVVYGVHAGLESAALTESEAFKETAKARIAFHNDCFLSGPNDVGTFEDYGSTTGERSGSDSVVAILRNYKKQDSKYVVVGGETCDDAFSPQNDCAKGGYAVQEMADMHYSFLNASYNPAVNNDWQTGGCMAEIKNRLGYRFSVQDATFPKKAKVGQVIKVTLNIENTGFAAPYNPRPVELLLRNKVSNKVRKFVFNTEIQTWYPGLIKLEEEFTLPSDMSVGDYEILLNLPDKYPSISNRADYSIRLANKDVWEEATGFNRLNHTLRVE